MIELCVQRDVWRQAAAASPVPLSCFKFFLSVICQETVAAGLIWTTCLSFRC